MTFTQYLLQKKKLVQQEIITEISGWKKSVDKNIVGKTDLTESLLLSNQGGKNIRGTLVCLGYEMHSVKNMKDIYRVAAAYEILHTSLLVHDDIMDQGTLRRGIPTLFQKLGGNHYGLSQVINLGDVGFFLSTKMISETEFADGIKSHVISFFSQTVLNTITGQMLDVNVSQKKGNVTENDIIIIARLKTAYYSFAAPLVIGAMLAGATKKQCDQLFSFGENLGIAYQLHDDFLGIFGDEKTTGKSATSDITEGKQTLLFLSAKGQATRKQKKILDKYYGKGEITVRGYEMIKQIFSDTGALTKTESMVEQYTDKAQGLVKRIAKDKSMQILLTSFIAYLLERKK